MSYFERRTRDSGETFTCMVDDPPEWVHDVVMDCHDGELPNDWRYETIDSIFDLVIDDEVTDAGEIADGLVDIYNADRLRWLAGHLERVSYVDEARDEGFFDVWADTVEQIGMGQYICIERMAQRIIDAVAENAEEDA